MLILLSEQDNFSEMVRSAYLDLFAAWLEVGGSADEYGQVLDQTLHIWNRIASPVAVAWRSAGQWTLPMWAVNVLGLGIAGGVCVWIAVRMSEPEMHNWLRDVPFAARAACARRAI